MYIPIEITLTIEPEQPWPRDWTNVSIETKVSTRHPGPENPEITSATIQIRISSGKTVTFITNVLGRCARARANKVGRGTSCQGYFSIDAKSPMQSATNDRSPDVGSCWRGKELASRLQAGYADSYSSSSPSGRPCTEKLGDRSCEVRLLYVGGGRSSGSCALQVNGLSSEQRRCFAFTWTTVCWFCSPL